jgi:serine/threonine-protein phosphatase 2A regulatory subunit A
MQLGKDFFTEKLISLCVGWLGDDIAMIRHAAATNVKVRAQVKSLLQLSLCNGSYRVSMLFLFTQDLAALFGTGWAIEHMIPPVLEIREHKSYLRRLTALQACSMICTVIDEDTARNELLPIVLEMANDGVSGYFLWFAMTQSVR